MTALDEAQLKMWLIEWDRSLKDEGELPRPDPRCVQSRVKQSRPELRFLTEQESAAVVRLAKDYGDLQQSVLWL